jgi:hypothetical protein
MRSGTQVVFDGQSHNNLPVGAAIPETVMADRAGVSWMNTAIGSTTYAQRAATAVQRVDRLTLDATTNVLVDIGGSDDIREGILTAAQILAAMEDYADDRRAAGFDTIVWSTVPTNTENTAGEELVRADLNNLIRAADFWDHLVDWETEPELTDASDLTFWSVDGLHLKAAGVAIAAPLYDVALDLVLA